MDGETVGWQWDGRMYGGVDAGMDGGRWDGRWTVGRQVDGRKKDGHGSWTVRSRKLDGMVTEAGRDGYGEWSKTKDLLY